MMKKFKYYANSFYGRILMMVLLGIGLIAVTVSVVVLAMSQNAFTKTYAASQEKVFEQIEKELNDFHKDLIDMVDAIDTSWAFRLYLNQTSEMDNLQTFQNIYQMEKDLEQSKPTGMERLNILVLGLNGKHYLSRTETISMSDEDIWESDAVQTALESPETIHYSYSHGAYTATAKDTDVIIASKALYYQESKEVYGIVLVTLTMDDLKKYYDYFVTEHTSFYMVGNNQTVYCSNDKKSVGGKLPDFGKRQTVMVRELSYFDCTIYGVIDNEKALNHLYNTTLLIVICVGIGVFVLILCGIFTRETIQPLSKLVEKMSMIKEGNFDEYMTVEGTIEVRELASTYNYMLDDIQSYIDELMEIQKEKRKSEIKALQMQINPHYIYNTLASIKWLVYQNDTQTTIQTIDAFISLLRNTISNADEFITIEQEVQNLNHYILINHTRYGEAIQVEFYVSQSCYDCLLPKMILQPFIENAFFHAFPEGRSGTIQILMRQKGQNLEIKIIDDGVGMRQDKAEQVVREKTHKEHFSGIGVNNVQDRLQLIYGKDYGIHIESIEKKGTTVTIILPVKRQEADPDEDET